ncbi:FecR family protein [Mucilaginibacter gracilis]|uniref:FecR family protein n=2 Tax=Mucilaginibacter gracilis TaxID=423350 RepID=A0A495J318_9SPHI|nr:FecR family protein [Mucilaginibacter gracilis]
MIVRTGLAAAGILLFLTAGVLIYQAGIRQAPQALKLATASTHAGEMKIITLSDGSRITLNNQTSIKYPEEFNQNTREVFLTGEAFFEVKHDANKPFRVHTDKLAVQVLGTSFNIQAYPDESGLDVAVASGKVGVFANGARDGKTYMLLPGQQLSYNRKNLAFSPSTIATAAIIAWQKGTLVFKNEKLEAIARRLERFYGVKIRFKNKKLMATELSLKANNLSLESVMKALGSAGEFNYSIKNKQVLIW